MVIGSGDYSDDSWFPGCFAVSNFRSREIKCDLEETGVVQVAQEPNILYRELEAVNAALVVKERAIFARNPKSLDKN